MHVSSVQKTLLYMIIYGQVFCPYLIQPNVLGAGCLTNTKFLANGKRWGEYIYFDLVEGKPRVAIYYWVTDSSKHDRFSQTSDPSCGTSRALFARPHPNSSRFGRNDHSKSRCYSLCFWPRISKWDRVTTWIHVLNAFCFILYPQLEVKE